MCKLHENLGFVVDKLKQLSLLPNSNLERLTEEVSCSTNNKKCMYGECPTCKLKSFPLPTVHDTTMHVTYTQWVVEEKEKTMPQENEAVLFKVTAKKQIESSLEELIEHFTCLLHRFKKHVFNIKQQFSFSRELKKTLSSNECIIHVDFSENYSCKYSSEIQAVHFGASHQQATMHTGVLYVGEVASPLCFCTISESKQKGPPAIWKHLEPILDYVQAHHPSVSVVHFFSDGPCTQYRQKGNFFLFSTELSKRGFESGTWNFFEASHGKGAPDGVGGVLKRLADQLVSQGRDIPDATTLYRALLTTGTTVKLFYVETDNIVDAYRNMPANIPPVPGTMRIHQVVTNRQGHLISRDVSCLCATLKNLSCTCFSTHHFIFPPLAHQMIQVEEPQETSNIPVRSQPTQSEEHLTEELPGSQEINWNNEGIIGEWCVLQYDNDLYPGIIVAKDEGYAQVKCMHRVGQNRYFWPAREDSIWYMFDDIIRLIPAPVRVTARHVEIQKDIWSEIVG